MTTVTTPDDDPVVRARVRGAEARRLRQSADLPSLVLDTPSEACRLTPRFPDVAAVRGFPETVDRLDETSLRPRCPECQTILRPDMVLFGEMLPPEKVERLYGEVACGFPLVFTIGTTSLSPDIAPPVLIPAQPGKPTVEINPGASEVSDLVDGKLPMGAAQVLDAIWQGYCNRVRAPLPRRGPGET